MPAGRRAQPRPRRCTRSRVTVSSPPSPRGRTWQRDPPAFSPANGLPVGTRAAALDVGQLGSSSQPHSYGVIVAQLPPSSSANLVAGWFRALASGLKPTRIDGYHGVRHVSIVKKGSATYFGGFELLQDGHAFFVLGVYDPSLPAVNRFLDSFSIRS